MNMPTPRIVAAAGCLLLAACAGQPSVESNGIRETERFEGTLPCDNCRGINTDLTLKRDPGTGAPAGFHLHETRIDAPGGERVNTSWGQWSLNKHGNGLQQKLYILQPEVGARRLYQSSADGELQPLDKRGNPISNGDGAPVVLNRLTPNPSMP